MPYAKYLSPTTEAAVYPFAAAILALKPGTSLLLQDSTPRNLRHLRDSIYTWMNLNRIKQHYRITSESPIQIRVLRRAASEARIVEATPLTSTETFVADNMLEISTLEEATSLLATAIKAGTITEGQAPSILAEWKRFAGESCQP